MCFLPNGDWDNTVGVQVYVGNHTDWTRIGIAKRVCRAMMATMYTPHFQCFNRKKWLQNDEIVCRLGLLESVHRLGSRTFLRFLYRVGHLKRQLRLADLKPRRHDHPSALPGAPEAAISDGLETHCDDGDMSGLTGEKPVGDGKDPLAEECGTDPAAHVKAENGAVDYAEQNTKHRRIALPWLRESDLKADLIKIRLFMEPNMAMLREQMKLGAKSYEYDQYKRGVGSKVNSETRRLPFRNRVSIAASGDLETKFTAQQEFILQSAELWSVLPETSCTEAENCLVFRMTSRSAAEIFRTMGRPHSKFPVPSLPRANQSAFS